MNAVDFSPSGNKGEDQAQTPTEQAPIQDNTESNVDKALNDAKVGKRGLLAILAAKRGEKPTWEKSDREKQLEKRAGTAKTNSDTIDKELEAARSDRSQHARDKKSTQNKIIYQRKLAEGFGKVEDKNREWREQLEKNIFDRIGDALDVAKAFFRGEMTAVRDKIDEEERRKTSIGKKDKNIARAQKGVSTAEERVKQLKREERATDWQLYYDDIQLQSLELQFAHADKLRERSEKALGRERNRNENKAKRKMLEDTMEEVRYNSPRKYRVFIQEQVEKGNSIENEIHKKGITAEELRRRYQNEINSLEEDMKDKEVDRIAMQSLSEEDRKEFEEAIQTKRKLNEKSISSIKEKISRIEEWYGGKDANGEWHENKGAFDNNMKILEEERKKVDELFPAFGERVSRLFRKVTGRITGDQSELKGVPKTDQDDLAEGGDLPGEIQQANSGAAKQNQTQTQTETENPAA